ncbi:MAG: hypothetical protein RIE56_04955 [Amphiplicatus sp.]
MARTALGAACVLIAALLVAPAHAQSNSVRLQLGGESAQKARTSSSQAGVRVWRGAAPKEELALLGGEETRSELACAPVTVVVKVPHRRANRLRTQGFYSGLERKGWKYTQGFYSGQKTYR